LSIDFLSKILYNISKYNKGDTTMKYERLDVFNKQELDRIKVGDKFIANGLNKYPMTVMAVTKDFIVGIKEIVDGYSYSLITKTIDGWSRNAASAKHPHVGPDSFYCLGYFTEAEAQKNLDKIQKWYDAAQFGILSEEYKNYEKAEIKKYHSTEVDYTPGQVIDKPIEHYHMILQDPRSRYTADLKNLKVLFTSAPDKTTGVENV